MDYTESKAMDILKIVAIGIVCAVLALSIKKTHPEFALQVSIGAGILIFMMVVKYLAQATEFIKNLSSNYGITYDSIMMVLKLIGIGYIVEFAVQILKDANENSIASKVELAGKVIIMVISLPVISTFIKTVLKLLE